MTLIKSFLLASAAGIVAVASAQAADLPTKKGAPAAEYVKICKLTVAGAPFVGFTIPGSDTCLKLSGYVTAQFTVAGEAKSGQDLTGMYVRGNVAWDAVSNTAAGPLVAHIDLNANHGEGFDSATTVAGANYAAALVDNAYLQWAGLTAGQHGSFFDFIAGGPAWDDIISPDHTGTGTLLFAYTASLGGGFSATLSVEQPESAVNTAITSYGQRSPDVVLNLTDAQGWGKVQVSGVAHEVYYSAPSTDTWGFAVLGGALFNFPGMAGSDLKLQGVYARDAVDYTGLTSPGSYNWSNGMSSGLPVTGLYDTTAAGNQSSGWSAAAVLDFQVNPELKISPEVSYGSVTYSNPAAAELKSLNDFVGGGTIAWTPVKALVFNLDLLYSNVNVQYAGSSSTNYDGFNAKLRIERDF